MQEREQTANVIRAYKDVINTRTKSKASIIADSELYAKRLGPIIGGVAGKLSPAVGYACADGLTVQEQCTVSNVAPFTGENLHPGPIPEANMYLREARFVNRVSAGTAAMIKQIRDYNPEVLSPAFSMPAGRTDKDKVRHAVLYSTDYRSSLYSLMVDYLNSRILMRYDINHLKMLMLECMHLYMELYRIKGGNSFTSDLTSLDMSRILQNIEAMIQYFQLAQNDKLVFARWDIIHELRQMEKHALGAKTDIIDYL